MTTNNKIINADIQGNYEDEVDKFNYICLTGCFYGYPLCCILHYYDSYSFDTRKLTCEQKCIDVSKNTDFIPCPCHTDDILNNKCKIEDLIDYESRKSKYDFPDDPDDVPLFVHFYEEYQNHIDKMYKLYMNT